MKQARRIRSLLLEQFEARRMLAGDAIPLPLVSLGSKSEIQFFEQGQTSVVTGAVLDLNNDGRQDYVVGKSSDSHNVGFYLSDTGGSPREAMAASMLGDIVEIAVRDLNADGWLDVIVASNRRVEAFLNLGHSDEPGSDWLGVEQVGFNSAAVSIAIGELNGDGIPDLVVGTGRRVEVRMGAGDGRFGDAINYLSGTGERLVAAADLDRDGMAELIVGRREHQDAIVLQNQGDGTFESGQTMSRIGDVRTIYVGDTDSDPSLDLIVGTWSQEAGNVLIWRGKADGKFDENAVHYETVGSPMDFAPSAQ